MQIVRGPSKNMAKKRAPEGALKVETDLLLGENYYLSVSS